MSERPPLRDDTRFASGRIAVFQYVTVAVFLFLISGFWKLQVQNPEYYNERAQQNSIKSVPVMAPRGRILDRDGRVIVDNRSSFSLILSRETLKEEHLRPIADGLNLDYTDLQNRLRRFRSRPKYEPIVIKEELAPGDLAFVDSHRDFFPELELMHSQRRVYPQDGMAAHVIGYTGEISEAELDSPEFARYSPGDVIGKAGIERFYNDQLMGVDGRREVVVDNRGRERALIGTKPAVPGKDLQLTLDLDLQTVAELVMEQRQGSIVALDPRTGEVLAMVSRPAYDPNKFATRIRAKDWKEITENPDKPLLNRAIQAQLAPGSTFKPIMALAGLETGTVDETWGVHCAGGASFYGHYHACHLKRGHGAVSLNKGIAQSCDVYFYTLGNKMGIDNIAYYAELAGLGKKTGIDLPHEADGIVPSPRWKLRNYRQKWYAGETISVSIGQGALTVTPVQLAMAVGGIAMGGVWHHPHLTKEASRSEKPTEWKLNQDNVRRVVNGMYAVVNEGGTGGWARIPGVEVCGKTGTAQVASNELVKSAKGGGIRDLRDNAWFVGFAPRNNPELVVVVLAEHWGHGSDAAGLVRDVIKVYFDKKARKPVEKPKEAAPGAAPGASPANSLQNLGLPAASERVPFETPPPSTEPAAEPAQTAPPDADSGRWVGTRPAPAGKKN